MIYSIHESNKVDEFVKSMPNKIPETPEDMDEKEVNKRFDDWHNMNDKEKRQALNKAFPPKSSGNGGNPSRDKYYKANHNTSVTSKRGYLEPNKSKFRENSIDLHGLDADNFLEGIGVSINMDNNTITIGQFTMDGYLGQIILAENGIILNEDHIIVEDKAVFKLLF